MIALQVKSNKALMSALLGGDAFDTFLLQEAKLRCAIYYEIDGRLNMDFYPEEERTAEVHPYEFQPWSEARETLFSLIRGKNTPISFHFVLQLKPDSAGRMLQKEYPEGDFSAVRALLISIRYENGSSVITTGTSYTTFVRDKTADQIWDKAVVRFLGMKGIEAELL